MAQQERVVRVFVSSTFRNMIREREILVKRIFLLLRRLCEERFVTRGNPGHFPGLCSKSVVAAAFARRGITHHA